MIRILSMIASLLIPLFAQAQEQVPACDSDVHDDLDFWVGKWDAVWEGGSGTNEITKEYNGCLIREDFRGSNLLGMSVSSYSQVDKMWRQTWIDEQNGYLDLKGYYDGDNYIFHTVPDASKPNAQLRMVFSDIKKDSFTWTWMGTQDGGENWNNLWQISYTRME